MSTQFLIDFYLSSKMFPSQPCGGHISKTLIHCHYDESENAQNWACFADTLNGCKAGTLNGPDRNLKV